MAAEILLKYNRKTRGTHYVSIEGRHRLRLHRMRLGMTLETAAKLIGIAPHTLCDFENAATRLTTNMFTYIMNVYKKAGLNERPITRKILLRYKIWKSGMSLCEASLFIGKAHSHLCHLLTGQIKFTPKQEQKYLQLCEELGVDEIPDKR